MRSCDQALLVGNIIPAAHAHWLQKSDTVHGVEVHENDDTLADGKAGPEYYVSKNLMMAESAGTDDDGHLTHHAPESPKLESFEWHR